MVAWLCQFIPLSPVSVNQRTRGDGERRGTEPNCEEQADEGTERSFFQKLRRRRPQEIQVTTVFPAIQKSFCPEFQVDTPEFHLVVLRYPKRFRTFWKFHC